MAAVTPSGRAPPPHPGRPDSDREKPASTLPDRKATRRRSEFLLQALFVTAANIAFVAPIDIAWDALTVAHVDVVETDPDVDALAVRAAVSKGR